MSNAQKWRRAALCLAIFAGFAGGNMIFAETAHAYATPRIKPPAPGPTYISASDLARLESIRSNLKRRNFAAARGTAATIAEPSAERLALWYYFYARDPAVSLSDADAYFDAQPDWPMATTIQRHVEDRIPDNAPADQVLAFFDGRVPVSGKGKIKLARAELAKGNEEAANFLIKDAWINDGFTVQDERKFLAQYGSRLTQADHAARVDRLLWRRQVTNARRVFSRLNASDRRKAQARAGLLLGANSGRTAYYNLPAKERADAGVTHAAIRYFRRAGEEPRAIAVARTAPTDPVVARNGAVLWDETQLLMRWALKEKQYADAYAMAAGHGLAPGSTDFSEAEFDAGWIALRYLGEPERAEKHFAALTASVKAPISLARGYYWLGRAAEARGAPEIAKSRYAQAAEHRYTFYGQMAAEKVGGEALTRQFQTTPPASPEDKALFGARPLTAALRILTDLKDDRTFLTFAYALDDQLETPGEYLELADLAARRGATHATVRAGKVAVRRNAFAPEVAYPLIFVPDEASKFAPQEIILGLSRQESEFNPRAYSRAGARGLMQLIPSTAQITARKEGLRYSRSALLDDPIYNMTIGSAHLSHLFQRFNGSYIMTLAAYNAGPHRVTQWVERYGDPRNSTVDPIDWVENIPFSETRNYVQRVLENTQVYRARFNEQPIPGRLSADLERGGQSGRAGAMPALSNSQPLPPVPDRIAELANGVLLNPPTPHLAPEDEGEASPATPQEPAPAKAVSVTPAALSGADSTHDATADKVSTDGASTGEASIAAQTTESAPTAIATNPEPARTAVPDLTPIDDPTANNLGAPSAAPDEEPARETLVEAAGAAAEQNVEPTEPLARPDADALAGRSDESFASAPFDGSDPDETIHGCQTYVEFIAETDQEEASASDLNAGMLAELQSGGSKCDEPDQAR